MKNQSVIAKRKIWRKRMERRYPWMKGKTKFINGILCDLFGNAIIVLQNQPPRLLKSK